MNKLRDTELCVAFGAHLKALRIAKGYTLRGFALEAEIEHSQLSKIENGTNNPTISTVLALSRALKIPMQEMFNFKIPIKKK